MRDRQEIMSGTYVGGQHAEDASNHTALILEVLLDIRDLLQAHTGQGVE